MEDAGNYGAPSSNSSWYSRKDYHGIEYQPLCIRNNYQLSLWRIDNLAVMKTKSAYFSSKDSRYADPSI